MHCPKCNSENISVVDSRGDGESIRRRRECGDCTYRFTTFERLERVMPIVIKKDDSREVFNAEKIRAGILRSCQKRSVPIETIDETVEQIEKAVNELCLKEVPSSTIGDLLLEALKDLDKIAYVRFASVYKEFSEVEQFIEALKELEVREAQRRLTGPPPREGTRTQDDLKTH